MMDWTARLAERRQSFPKRPHGEVPKVPEPHAPTAAPTFGTFGTLQDGTFQKIDPPALRARLLELADAEGIERAHVEALAPADLDACAGLPDDALRAYLHMLRDAALRARGRVPADETAPALCACCGPVWLAPEVAAVAPVVAGWPRVLGCPWCHLGRGTSKVHEESAGHRPPSGFSARANRETGFGDVPRPSVACAACRHFTADAINPGGGMGRCTAGREPSPSEPLHYPHAERQCGRFDPKGTP